MKKKYMKLIGSIVLAFCMVVTGVVATINAQATEETVDTVDRSNWKDVGWSDEEVAYTQDIDSLYESSDESSSVIPEGYLFAGWYERTGDGEPVTEEVEKTQQSTDEDGNLVFDTEGNPVYETVVDEEGNPVYETVVVGTVYDADDFTAVKAPKEGESWYVKYVPEEMLSAKAQNSLNIISGDPEINVADNAIRFVTSLDSTQYKEVGFKVFIGDVDQHAEDNITNFVYKTIYQVNASDTTDVVSSDASSVFKNLASQYFKTYTITNIDPKYFGEDIVAIPYYETYDGTIVYGTATVRSVDFCNGVAYVTDAGTNTSDLKVDDFDVNQLRITKVSSGTEKSPATLPIAVANWYNNSDDSATVYIQESIVLTEEAIVEGSMTITNLTDEITITPAEGLTTENAMICVSGANTSVPLNVTVKNITIDGNGTEGAETNIRALSVGKNSDNCTLNIYDTTVQNFASTKQGGSLMVRGTVNLENSTIKDGSSTQNGALVNIDSGALNVKEGALISNGTSTTSGGCMRINTNGVLNMEAGTIQDGECTSTISNNGNGGNIWCAGTINMSGGTIQNGKAITPDNLDKTGCGGNIYLNSNGKLIMTGGTISGGQSLRSSDYSAEKTHNGFGGGNICSLGSEVSISGTAVVKDGVAYQRGGNIYMYGQSGDECTLNIEDATAESTLSGGTATYGGSIFANRCTTTIKNVTQLSGGEASSNGGLMVAWHGSVSITDAKLSGGTAANGGCIFVDNACELIMNSGAEITGGNASQAGGNIRINASAGKLTMNGGTITLGIAGTEDITDANYGLGGNIYCKGTVIMKDGIISAGEAQSGTNDKNDRACGGNIFMYGSSDAVATLDVQGGTIENGIARNRGGNINCYAYTTCTLKDATINNGTAVAGGSIFNNGTSSLEIDSTDIDGGNATKEGGNIKFGSEGYNFIIKNGSTITDGIAGTGKGGNIYSSKKASEFKISNSTISGGTAGSHGGNIHSENSDWTIEADDGKKTIIQDGTAKSRGGNVSFSGGTLTLGDNVQISGGTAGSAYGTGVHVWDPATLEIDGEVQFENANVCLEISNATKYAKVHLTEKTLVSEAIPLKVLLDGSSLTMDVTTGIGFITNVTDVTSSYFTSIVEGYVLTPVTAEDGTVTLQFVAE